MEHQLSNAIVLRKNGKYEEAQKILIELSDKYPDNGAVLYECASVHDNLGLEHEAIPYYEKALRRGLNDQERKGALIGLGSSYRTTGNYQKAKATFEEALKAFPSEEVLYVLYALTLHNLKEHGKAIEILLKKLVTLSNHPSLKEYERAILFYADRIDEVW